MQIQYEQYDSVEFRGQYWMVMAIDGYNTVYLRNNAGGTACDVPIDQIKPTPKTIKDATCFT